MYFRTYHTTAFLSLLSASPSPVPFPVCLGIFSKVRQTALLAGAGGSGRTHRWHGHHPGLRKARRRQGEEIGRRGEAKDQDAIPSVLPRALHRDRPLRVLDYSPGIVVQVQNFSGVRGAALLRGTRTRGAG